MKAEAKVDATHRLDHAIAHGQASLPDTRQLSHNEKQVLRYQLTKLVPHAYCLLREQLTQELNAAMKEVFTAPEAEDGEGDDAGKRLAALYVDVTGRHAFSAQAADERCRQHFD